MICGAFIGSIGAVVQNLYGLSARLAGVKGPIYWDYGKVLIFSGKVLSGILPTVLGTIAHLVWDIILGIVFVYLIRDSFDRYLVLKGVVYGAIVWFIIKTIATLFRVPVIVDVSPYTVLFFFIGSLFFGLVIAYSLRVFINRLHQEKES